jgi:hypothetical protein
MGEGGTETATVEVDEVSILVAGEHHAPVESVLALPVDEAEALQEIESVAARHKMTPQAPAGGVSDAEFFEQSRLVHSTLFEVPERFGVVRELLLIEGRGLL